MNISTLRARWRAVAPYLLSTLRIVTAFLFMQFGTAKWFAFPGSILPDGGTVAFASLVGLAALLEVIGGALALVGVFARPVAFLLSGEMAVAYFMGHAPQGFWPVLNQGTPAILFSFVWLYISAAGPGPWSVDAWRQGRTPTRVGNGATATGRQLCVILGIAIACGTGARFKNDEQSMSTTFDVRHISVSIDRSPKEVYDFISDGANLASWASGLGTAIRREGDQWVAQGSIGTVRVRLANPNDFGVADQDVTLDNGATVHNPIRVVPNGAGSTVTFMLMRLPGVSQQKFTDDGAWVQKDLDTLKRLLENR
jgi:putative oxidoreductase